MPDDRRPLSAASDHAVSKAVSLPDVPKLMAGKRGLIMGVANERSIAWGIAQALHQAGAELAFTYQGGAFGKRVLPMVEKIGARIVGHGRYVTFQMAEVAVPRGLFAEILRLIAQLRAPPAPA